MRCGQPTSASKLGLRQPATKGSCGPSVERPVNAGGIAVAGEGRKPAKTDEERAALLYLPKGIDLSAYSQSKLNAIAR